MKKILLTAFIIFLVKQNSYAQEIKIISLSPLVGNEIDSSEKKKYHLFPYFDNRQFIKASIYNINDSSYVVRAFMKNDLSEEKKMSSAEFNIMKNQVNEIFPTNENKHRKLTSKIIQHNGDSSTSYIMLGTSFLTFYNPTIQSKYQIIDKNVVRGLDFIGTLLIAFDSPISGNFFLSTELGKMSVFSYIDLQFRIDDGTDHIRTFRGRGTDGGLFIKNSEYFSLGLGYAFHYKKDNGSNGHAFVKMRLDLHHTIGYYTNVTEEEVINGKYTSKDYQNYTFGDQGFQPGVTMALGNNWHYRSFGLWAEIRYQNMFLSSSTYVAEYKTRLSGIGLNIGTSIAIPKL